MLVGMTAVLQQFRYQLDSPLVAFFLLGMLYSFSTILAFFVCTVAIIMLCKRYWQGRVGVLYFCLLVAVFALYSIRGAYLFFWVAQDLTECRKSTNYFIHNLVERGWESIFAVPLHIEAFQTQTEKSVFGYSVPADIYLLVFSFLLCQHLCR